MPPIPKVHEGDTVQLRKSHPCGSDLWRILRLGSDVLLYSEACDHRITLSRGKFNKAVKRVLPMEPPRQQTE